jgi:hypothetical protein
MQKPEKMDQEVLKDPQLKLMHQIHNKQQEGVEIKELSVERILSDTQHSQEK